MFVVDHAVRGMCCWLMVLLLWVAQSIQPAFAQSPTANQPAESAAGVWLVTYGTGELYWQSFGHNGIWIRDPDLGIDHVFNFGFFDFEQEDFFLRFLQGRMLYFSAAQPVEQEFAQYIDENRSIRLQKLALQPAQSLRLTDYLVQVVQPENRDYLYDYYRDNCSTRVRDALDFALGGLLESGSSTQQARQTYRDHTRRLTSTQFWLYLGLELVLGKPVDQPISRWDEFFIPAELAEGISELELSGTPLVEEDVMLFQSTRADPPQVPPVKWPLYGVVFLLLFGLPALAIRRWLAGNAVMLSIAWMVLAGLAGSAMVFFWFGTNHAVAAENLNLLLFNPLALLLVFPALRTPVARLLIGSTLLAGLLAILPVPPGQYTADVVAAVLPLNLLTAWILLRKKPRVEKMGPAV